MSACVPFSRQDARRALQRPEMFLKDEDKREADRIRVSVFRQFGNPKDPTVVLVCQRVALLWFRLQRCARKEADLMEPGLNDWDAGAVATLGKYEAALSRDLHKNLALLRSLQPRGRRKQKKMAKKIVAKQNPFTDSPFKAADGQA